MEGRAEFKLQCIKLTLIAQAIISYDIKKKVGFCTWDLRIDAKMTTHH